MALNIRLVCSNLLQKNDTELCRVIKKDIYSFANLEETTMKMSFKYLNNQTTINHKDGCLN